MSRIAGWEKTGSDSWQHESGIKAEIVKEQCQMGNIPGVYSLEVAGEQKLKRSGKHAARTEAVRWLKSHSNIVHRGIEDDILATMPEDRNISFEQLSSKLSYDDERLESAVKRLIQRDEVYEPQPGMLRKGSFPE